MSDHYVLFCTPETNNNNKKKYFSQPILLLITLCAVFPVTII